MTIAGGAARRAVGLIPLSCGEETMNSDGLNATEAECATGRTAPRVSLEDIKSNIAGEFYNTADLMFPGAPVLPGMDLLTVCILVLENGFTIVGKSAPASRANFDPVLGQKLAFEDAVRQVWPLMGYALRQKLHEATMPEVHNLDVTEQPTG
ncbi:Gp49 family protein [Sphingomonas zeae]